MDKFRSTSIAPFKEAVKDSPSHVLPGAAAIIVISLGAGLVFTVATGLICLGLDKPFRIALVTGGAVMFLVALYWFLQGQNIMWTSERITGIDQEGVVGQPQLPPPHVVIEAQKEDSGSSWVLADLPGDPRIQAAWIEAAGKRQSLAIEYWEPLFGYTITKYGQQMPVYTLFRSCLIQRGWLIDRGSHGVILSNEGRRILTGALPQLLALPSGEEE